MVVVAIAGVLIGMPATAAEYIVFRDDLFELSIPVKALEAWVQTGQVKPALAEYLDLLKPGQKEQLRELLQTSYQDDFLNLSKMSHTSIGESFLRNIGAVIQVKDGKNGFENLREALIKSDADPGGVSLLNLMRYAPENFEINLAQLLGLMQKFSSLTQRTSQFMSDLEQVTTTRSLDPADAQQHQSFDLRETGPLSLTKQTLQLQMVSQTVHRSANVQNPADLSRTSDGEVDLYLPQTQQFTSVPVIVISGGLGARRDSFASLARHWTSHGFAVVIPDHPGSNEQRRQDFADGLHQDLFEAAEFMNRPQEITAVLDELERLNLTQLKGQLNLQQVGVFSHSFGGPTALALAGAELNRAQLKQDCVVAPTQLLNISLMYQCEVLRLSQPFPKLKDNRIKAIFLLAPFGKSMFGATGIDKIDLPVLWSATDIDLLAPLLLEQVPTFSWLTTPNKYLAVSKGLHHGQITFEYLFGFIAPDTSLKQLKAIGRSYQKALGLAFFKVHVAQDQTYRPYLQASYAREISETPHTLHLVRSAPTPPPAR